MRKTLFWYLQWILLILCLWWLLSVVLGSRLVPPPHRVLPVLWTLLSRGLAAHAAATLGRAVAALLAALRSSDPGCLQAPLPAKSPDRKREATAAAHFCRFARRFFPHSLNLQPSAAASSRRMDVLALGENLSG